MEFAGNTFNSSVWKITVLLTAASERLNAFLSCSAAIYLHTDMYIPVTAELLLGRKTKAMVPECYRVW